MATQMTPTSEFFADNVVTAQVLNVIKNAKHRIALVSPYVDRVGHVEQELVKAKGRGVDVLIVVRRDGNKVGGTNSKDALDWFKINGFDLQSVPNLHAKFYMNEFEGVITSMNLLRSSWAGSLEVGISVTDSQHEQLVEYLRDHLKEFFTEIEASKTKPAAKKTQKIASGARRSPRQSRVAKPKKQESGGFGSLIRRLILSPAGYCIRCGDELSEAEVDAGKTMCAKDYASWARFKNPDFKEKYCTNCGEEKPTTFAKPECQDCYYN